MDHRVNAAGIETYGALSPWSDIASITLVREPEVTQNEITIALRAGPRRPRHERLHRDPQDSPSWNQVLDGVPKHLELRVADLDDVIAAGEPGEMLLWQPVQQR